MSNDRALFIRLYIDEDVHGSVGSALRQRGYDVLTVGEAKRGGLSDANQSIAGELWRDHGCFVQSAAATVASSPQSFFA